MVPRKIGMRNRHRNERAGAQRRKSARTNTVTENADVFSAFIPENGGCYTGGEQTGKANHREAFASQR